jgi:UDP-GlcNAc:undecaprenyl-phosphate/decaprenyl-phosphate GlcNAc-1-phosphate transferase
MYIKPMVIAAIITLSAIYFLRPFAVNIKLLDLPNERKKHEGSIPLIGGIAMFLGVIVSIFLSPIDLNNFNYFLTSALIVVLIGVFDDHSSLPVSYRLLFQIIAALILVTVGEEGISSLGNLLGYGEITLNEWSMLLSVFAIIAGINAVNMADGLHGLAGGNSLISFIAISILSIKSPSQDSILIALVFCSVLPIFLIHNLCLGISSTKRIFMGDAGSMFIGLTIVWVLFDFSQGEEKSFAPVIALWLFALPLMEIASTVLRRLMSGVSPFKPDTCHFHHLLQKLGYSKRKTLTIILFFSALMAVIGILGEIFNIAENLMFFGFILVFFIYFYLGELAYKKVLKLN